MRPDDAETELNSSRKFHFATSAQHADKLLAEVEFVLHASKSKSAFKKYKNSLLPARLEFSGIWTRWRKPAPRLRRPRPRKESERQPGRGLTDNE